MTCNCTVCIH